VEEQDHVSRLPEGKGETMTSEAFICPSRTAAMFDAILESDGPTKPHFENVTGFRLDPTTEPGMFEFYLTGDRLCWIDEDGSRTEPDQRFLTDGMSGGWLVSALVQCTTMQFLGPFFHDSGYRHGGLWRNGVFVKMTKMELDWLLARMIRSQGSWWIRAGAVYVGLQTPVSWVTWHWYRTANEPPEPPAGIGLTHCAV
jgi:hypothetical protein